MLDGEEVDDVEELTYQEAIVDKEGRGSKDIMHHLQKVCGAFQSCGWIGSRGRQQQTREEG